jgi:hypothetical protein
MNLTGQCHCGALAVEFETEVPPEATQVRACQCGFCRAHGALSATDPAGLLTFRARDPSVLARERFGLKVADFLLCARCGTYLGAIMQDGEGSLGVLNICALEARDRFGPPVSMRYDGETPEMRLKRRRERWTPARLVT